MNGAQQCLRIRVGRFKINRLSGRNFYNLAQVYDHDAITDMLHNTQIVGHKEIRQSELVLEIFQHVQDLCLNRYVKGRHGFITHDQHRIWRQGPGNTQVLGAMPTQLQRPTAEPTVVC